MATWKTKLMKACEENGDNFNTLVTTMTDEEMNMEFDDGYGSTGGCAFTAWGEKYVYFPVVYDGLEWVGCVPRNPCDIKTEHLGGG